MQNRAKLPVVNENQIEKKGISRRDMVRRLMFGAGAGAALSAIVPSSVLASDNIPNASEHIGLNFIRPDANRPGNYDFIHKGPWLVDQYKKMGVKWSRMAFSWVVIQPEAGRYDWSAYDRIVDACRQNGIEILATLGGHFDRPPVPTWAGASLAEVVKRNPALLHAFIRSLAERYKGTIHYHEVLNEPDGQHCGLTVKAYVEGILKPAYSIHKSVNPHVKVLPCSYNHLPRIGNREDFWGLARGYYDIDNLHVYENWGHFRTDTTAKKERDAVLKFRAEMEKHGEGKKSFWITEIGWWGTAGLTGVAKAAEENPEYRGKFKVKPFYTGREWLDNPVITREDGLRAVWMKNMFPRMLAIPGCEKVFLWSSMDEFQGGWRPDALYGRPTVGRNIGQADLWGVIAGDGKWRKSAYVLQEMLG